MVKVFWGGDLFDQKHLTGNHFLAQSVDKESAGRYRCIVPQDITDYAGTAVAIRNNDLHGVFQADLAIFNFDGPDVDSGTAVEFIVAKMLDIPAVLLRTDFRVGGYPFGDDWNLMMLGFPRCQIVKQNCLDLYACGGHEGMHRAIAQAIVAGLDQVAKEQTIFNSYEEILFAYRHAIKMCGARLSEKVTPKNVEELIARKIENGVYKIEPFQHSQKTIQPSI